MRTPLTSLLFLIVLLIPGQALAQFTGPERPARWTSLADFQANAAITVAATDSLYEDRVEVTWTNAGDFDVFYRVLRDTTLLSVLSSTDSSFVDHDGDPGTVYSYSVKLVDVVGDTTIDMGSDLGSRRILPPGSVVATDGTLAHGVRIDWIDQSLIESGYRILRRPTGVGAFAVLDSVGESEEVYVDVTAAAPTVYDYRVIAFNADGFTSRGGEDSGWTGFVVPPGNVQATDGTFSDRVRITWVDQSPDETGFNVYRNGNLVGTVGLDVTAFDDVDSLGVLHSYAVAAVVDTGGPVLESVLVSDTGIGGPQTLAGADSLVATIDTFDDRVNLMWNDGADHEDAWMVERDGVLIASLGPDTESFDDPDAEPGITYTYGVYAAADSGGTSTTLTDTGRRAVILAPQNVSASDGTHEGFVEIRWESSATSVVLFKILRDGTPFRTVNGTLRSTVDTDIASGATHTYCVVAVTAFEDESPSGCDDGFRRIKAPTEVSASNDAYEDRVLITWKDNSKVETGYNVYRRVSGAGTFALLGTRPAGRTAYVDTAAAPDSLYDYEVEAADALGVSTRTGDTGSRRLSEPTFVEASDGTLETMVVVDWLDNSRFETGYAILRKVAGAVGSPVVIDSVGSDTMTYDDATIAFGVEYEYTVQPFDDLGLSPVTDAVDTGFSSILPPLSLNASDAYASKVVLAWVDQSVIETGYEISRRAAASGTFAVLDTTFASAETWTDLSATSGVEYEYCVRSVSGAASSEPACDFGSFTTPNTSIDIVVDTFIPGTGVATGDRFATAVAVDGDHMIVGAPGKDTEGKVYFYKREDTGWVQTAEFAPPVTETNYGKVVDIHGDYAIALGDGGPTVVYERTLEGDWVYYGRQGLNAALTATIFDGTLAVTGLGIFEGSDIRTVGIYSLDGEGGFDVDYLIRDPNNELATLFGETLMFRDGELFIAAPGPSSTFDGAYVYVTKRVDGVWGGALFSSDRLFGQNAGFGAAMDAKGSQVAIVDHQGSVNVYSDAADGVLTPQGFPTTVRAGQFSPSIAIWEKYLAVGTPDGDTTGADPGVIQLYERNLDGSWDFLPVEVLTTSRATGGDDIGRSVSMDNGTLVFGAPGDDVGGPGAGSLALFELQSPPTQVTASDAAYADRIQIKWKDRSTQATPEDGFNVYRDGVLIESTGPNIQSFNDFEAQPGRAYRYGVTSLRGGIETDPVTAFGRLAPNGVIAGRVETRAGAAVNGVDICLDPSPNSSVLFDGAGHVNTAKLPVESSFTLEFWVNEGRADFFSEYFIRFLNGSQEKFVIGASTSSVVFSDASGGTSQSAPAGETFKSNTWYHIAAVVNLDDEVDIYVNGQFAGNVEYDIAEPGNISVRMGGFLGRLDDVRLWGTKRTQSQIQEFMNVPLTGNEEDLLGYWPFDEGTGRFSADPTDDPAYAVLDAGSHWSNAGAPLTICAVSDIEGNYVLDNLRYGNETTFKVTPQLPNRVFEPGFKTITLSTGSPVQNEVAFRDISSYTMSGFVQLTNVILDPDAFCFAPNVEILVDGEVKGVTDDNGNFSIALPIGDHVIEPRFADHTFSPPTLPVTVTADTSGIRFTDTTLRNVSGLIGGGCGLDIGTLEIEFVSENGCFSKEDYLGNGNYQIQLPPQTYFVTVRDVTNIPAGLDKADVLEFFDLLGTREINLAEADTTLDFVYRAPIRVRVSGFDPAVCTVPPRNVPVLAQGDQVQLTIEVFEDYGPGNECPVDSASVTIYDEIVDEADNPVVITVENGVATYVTIANTPNVFAGRRDSQGIDRSYQKPITAVADVGGTFATRTEWVIVTGHRPRVPTFTSVTETFPILILRDPPGDNSFSFLQEGTTECSVIQNIGLETLSLGLSIGAKTGVEFEKGSPFWTTKTEVAVSSTDKVTVGVTATQGDGLTICTTIDQTFSTSANELFVGEGGDVFLGVALNLVFAKTDVIEFDPQTCIITKSEQITVGGDDQEPFDTIYLYTADHIENTVIPQLEEIAASVSDPDSATFFSSAADNWQTLHLDLNDRLKDDAILITNRSFSAGADFSYSETQTETDSFTWSVKAFANYEGALGFKFEESGNGTNNQFLIGVTGEYTRVEEESETETETVGYTLSDDDIGDFFSVNVRYDGVYGTPVFEVVSGTSSCPWEPWYNDDGEPRMQPRDQALLAVEPPELRDVPPTEAATFTLALTNDSQSGEAREYVLRTIQTSNPGGAVLAANGSPIHGGISFFIEPQQSQEVTLTVKRGPRRYLYEDIQLQLVSPCEYARWQNGGPLQLADTVSVTVGFEAPCSEISLFRPQSGWTHNATDGDNIEVILNDFELQISEDDSIESVGAEYRLANTDNWLPIGEIQKVQIPTDIEGDPQSVSLFWNITNLPQGGRYEIRGFTRCDGGSNYSIPATGVLDLTPPTPFGPPQPADSVLSLGEQIKVTFDEAILCESLNAANVSLDRVNLDLTTTPVQIDVSCSGSSVIITPVSPDLASLEGKTLIASLTGIRDLAGNLMEARDGSSTEIWEFEVRQSVFTWEQGSLVREVAFRNPGSVGAILVNGTNGAVDYEIIEAPVWLTPTSPTGTLQTTQSEIVRFNVDPLLPIGIHQGTLRAVVRNGLSQIVLETPLFVQLEVVCVPPAWEFNPAGFEQSMTVVAQVSIGGALSIDPDDMIAAFVGNEMRGLASPELVSQLGDYMVFLSVYSNRLSGEAVRFEVYDASECLLYPAADRTLAFQADDILGGPDVPELIVAGNTPPSTLQQIPVGKGWTWISFNLYRQDMSIGGVLDDLNLISGDLAKSQVAFSQFDPTLGWAGSLGTIENTTGYMIHLSEAGTISLDGIPAKADSVDVPVGDGWTWIPYLPQGATDVNTALDDLSPTENDVIKSQYGFAQYLKINNNTKGWVGSLQQMEPGLAYKLYLTNAQNSGNAFQYPVIPAGTLSPTIDLASRRGLNLARESGTGANEAGWSVDPHAFQYNMTITAAVEVNDAVVEGNSLVLGAFVGDELRGMALLQSIPGLEGARAFLMAYSNQVEGEELTFRIYDPLEDRVAEAEETTSFAADASVGTLSQPHSVRVRLSGEGPTVVRTLTLAPMAPNPLPRSGSGLIRFTLPESGQVTLHVFDIQGRMIRTLLDERREAGEYEVPFQAGDVPAGVYFYRIRAGNEQQVRRVVITG